MILAVIFWSCITLIAYTYVFYPLVIYVWSSLKPALPSRNAAPALPSVSIVISVYNEEAVLEEKLKNLAALDYPSDRIEIIIGSDGSSDRTNVMLSASDLPIVRPILFPQRRGKAAVINALIAQAKGDIIILSDANTFYDASTARSLVEPFVDPTIGAVCGELILQSESGMAGSVGESSYWNYENIIKSNESRIHSTLGATGAVYAIRKDLFVPIPTEKVVADDFLIPMNILMQGYRNCYEPRAVAYERLSNSISGEFRRKVRISAGNFTGIAEFARLLHPRFGFIAFALWSHKIIRWIVPGLLPAALLLNVFLAARSEFYQALLYAHLFFYLLSVLGFLLDTLKLKAGILSFPYYFVAMNAALLVGFVKFILGRQRPTWDVVR